MTQALTRITALFFAGALLACGSDSTSPTLTAAGNYTATFFQTTGSSGSRNELLAGSTLVLNLNANGTTSGHLHIAAAGTTPAFDADMAGTWQQEGMTVEISQAADTFVRDMPFTLTPASASAWELVGDHVFAGTRVQLTLSRT